MGLNGWFPEGFFLLYPTSTCVLVVGLQHIVDVLWSSSKFHNNNLYVTLGPSLIVLKLLSGVFEISDVMYIFF